MCRPTGTATTSTANNVANQQQERQDNNDNNNTMHTTDDQKKDVVNVTSIMKKHQQQQPCWPEDDDTDDTDGMERSNKNNRSSWSLTKAVRNIYNKYTYSYMNVILRKGKLQRNDKTVQLTQSDLYNIPKNQTAHVLRNKFWYLYYDKHSQNLFKTLWYLAAPEFVPAGICQLIALIAQLSIPICVQQLLRGVEESYYNEADEEAAGIDDSSNSVRLLYMCFIIFSLSVINAVATHRYQFLSYQSGITLRTAVTSVIYEHSLNLRNTKDLTNGQITNLVATDTQKLFEVMSDGHMIWSAPLAILIVITLLLIIIGPSCFIGALILVGLIPLSKNVAHLIVGVRKKRVAVADERIEIITSMLQGIQVTKLNNYENQFEQRVQNIRFKEMKLIQKEQRIWGFTLVIRVFTPVVASFATFITYVYMKRNGEDKNLMTASIVFTVAMLFNMLKFPINQAGQLLSKASLGYQAMTRISQFLQLVSHVEDKGDYQDHNHHQQQKDVQQQHQNEEDDHVVLKVQNGTFYVGGSGGSTTRGGGNEEKNPTPPPVFTLSGINFEVKRGEVVAVVGEVASGKSTLIQGLLGDIQSSSTTTVQMKPHTNLSLAGQTPFILSDTVRANILFGTPYNKERYEKVLDSCCLRPDLSIWPAGDMTEIGERGVTMSGGQKQRVSIARAVYSNPDIALFDDILSALDAGTSQRVFDNLFETTKNDGEVNGLLHNSGVVLVTHAVHVLQRVNKILVLDDGESIFYGTWEELQSFQPQNEVQKVKLDKIRSSLQLNGNDDEGDEDVPEETSTTNGETKTNPNESSMVTQSSDAEKGTTMTKEEREHGISSLGIWLLWYVVCVLLQALTLLKI